MQPYDAQLNVKFLFFEHIYSGFSNLVATSSCRIPSFQLAPEPSTNV